MHFSFISVNGSESYPEQPKELHEKIATSGTWSDRWHLADREDLSLEVIAILAQDSDPEVRSSIAMNYITPAGILASLANQHPDLVPLISMRFLQFLTTNRQQQFPLYKPVFLSRLESRRPTRMHGRSKT